MKTRQGKLTIAATVRNMRASRIVDLYLKSLDQTNQPELKLSRSTLIRILKSCTARRRKSLAGIDYYTAAGAHFCYIVIHVPYFPKYPDRLQ